ncbi:MAG TPA: helix-turn-helix transcriptional regulator, partial [Candidatus Limnocylindrales bacterium]|jgi:transcriptional regulator with XRE-family HTH domain|nr:helix-turn-helix transcriptional regulator [Candidatus Limnocylindrales bacterium]
MGRRHRAQLDGERLARRLQQQLGEEIRLARTGAGVPQRIAAEAAGMSHAQLGRIERGAIPRLTFDQACRAGMAVGLRIGARAYPVGDPVRDAGQLRLLERFVSLLPALARVDREAALPLPGDLRAWDALVSLDGRRAGCEAETHLRDIQALERKLSAKLRDGGVDILLLVVSDTAYNRSVLADHRETLRALLPLDGLDIRRALRNGRLPARNGLILV